ncbi:MAG: urea ABC transporter permease subunit UrtC [Oscillospiraceae bacterium]|nr:urea ABC transporter permease subunit UrtC [Oscillospiraceae bacterium]
MASSGSDLGKSRRSFKEKLTATNILAVVIFVFLAVVPLFMSPFRVNMFGKYMCFALVALGLDMIWGYTGILSLGHGVYFGIGAYCMAMHLKLEASGGGLPDFMTWSGITELPGFWKPFADGTFTIIAIVAFPVLLAALIGTLTFLNRIKGVYFSILSQALAYALATFLIGRQEFFGGSNGLTGFTSIFGVSLASQSTKYALFYITLAALVICFIICRFLVSKRFGRVCLAVRDAENRARFTGYSPAAYKVFVYCLSAALAGIAGALYVPQVGIVSPTDIGITPSTEMVIWTAIGGKATLIGPVLGALLVNLFKSLISENFPSVWQFFLGAVCVIVILLLPGGLVSLKDVPARIRSAKEKKEANAREMAKAQSEEKAAERV